MIGVGPSGPKSASRGRASERDHWIALSQLPGIGPASFAQLVQRHGSAAEAWRTGVEHEPDRDPREVVTLLDRRTQAAGGRIVTALDDEYPLALRNLDPRPPTLFIAGDGTAFSTRAVAIVGTRRASGYGLTTTAELADELGRAGMTVVSGLALGIDGAAHRAAVRAGARSIAVLPSPLDRVYPPRHRSLAREIVRTGGALITELAIGAAVGRPDFARRNRIIAGLAEAVVVVEAPDRSGALLTASAAIGIGRELYAVPGPIDALASRGCNRLIADHDAEVVTSVAGLMRVIGIPRDVKPPAVNALSEVEGQLLKHLLQRSGSIEELIDRSGQPPASVASALSLLESRGLVNPFGGATFHPTLAAKRLARVV